MASQDDFADLGQRRTYGSHLEENIDAITIGREHALKAGHLPCNTFQPGIDVAARSFIHVATGCMVHAVVTELVTNPALRRIASSSAAARLSFARRRAR